MSRNSTARRTNVVLCVVGALLVIGAVVVSVVGGGSRSGGRSATTTTVVASGPASVNDAWFVDVSDDSAVEYPVSSLTCAQIALHLTLDLCAVAGAGDGQFMLIGQEGYWSPDEPDFDGTVRIPFDLTVYVSAETDEGTVARPAMSAVVSLPYGSAYDELSVYRPTLEGTETAIIIVWSQRNTLQSPALDAVQVISVLDGRPAVVATEFGTDMRIGTADGSIALVTPILGTEAGDPLASDTLTIVRLMPGSDGWARRVETVPGAALTSDIDELDRLNGYGFPRER